MSDIHPDDKFDGIQCPFCGSFAWFYDDTAIVTGPDGALLDMNACHCEDCDLLWAVEPVALDEDNE